MMPSFFDTDFFLGELPEGEYLRNVDERVPAGRRRHFSTMFADTQREYNKALAMFASKNRGRSPTSDPRLSRWSRFLENYDWEDKFYEAPFSAREPNFQAFNPRTRFLY